MITWLFFRSSLILLLSCQLVTGTVYASTHYRPNMFAASTDQEPPRKPDETKPQPGQNPGGGTAHGTGSPQVKATVGSNADKTQLAIVGGGFTNAVKVQVGETLFAVDCKGEVECVSGLKLSTKDGSATVITWSPTKAQIKDVKQVLVVQDNAQPVPLMLAPPPPATPPAKIIAPTEPLSVGEGDSVLVKFQGVNFDSIKKVAFEGGELVSKPDEEDKTVRWVEIPTLITVKRGKKRIVFVMKDDKEVPYTLVVH